MKFKLTKEQRDLFKPCEALHDNEHWAVFIYLMHNLAVSLTDATKEFDSTYWEIKPMLEDLIRAELVEQFIIRCEDVGDLDKRYYRASITGLRFYYLIFDALFPRRDT